MTTTTVVPQHLAALAYANEIRFARAAVKRTVAALPREDGCALLASYVQTPPDCLRTARLEDVLTWPRRHGRQKSIRLMNAAQIADTFTVERLTDRQRAAVVALLSGAWA